MSEAIPPTGEEPLLAIQQQLHDAHKELRGDRPFVAVDFDAPEVLAAPLRAELAGSTVGDLLVAHGEVLQPDMTRYSGSSDLITIRPGIDAEVIGVSVGTYGRYNKRRRFVPTAQAATLEGRDDVRLVPLGDQVKVEFPGKYDWAGNVHLTFWYSQQFLSGMMLVGERLTVSTYYDPGELPDLQSSVASRPKDKDDVTNRLRMKRPAQSEEEALVIVNAVRRLNAAREATS